MPLAFALVASVLLHAAALVGSGWVLPGTLEPELPTTIDAVIAKPVARAESTPVAKPVPRPPASKPRPPSPAQPVVVAEQAPAEPLPPPPAVEPAPVAVPPAPTFEPNARAPVQTALPGKGRVRYVITRGEGGFVIGQAVHSWEHDGFHYRLKTLIETTGLAAVFKPAQVLQSSQGEVTDDGLRPKEFRHERTGGIDTASFDWLNRFVTFAGRRESLVGGTQDMLSMYYQLVLLAPITGALEMPITTGRKLQTYRFDVLGEETLTLTGGERRALRIKAHSGDDIIELWLGVGDGAAARGLPLKIRFVDRKGEIFDQTVDGLDSTEARQPNPRPAVNPE